MPYITPSTLPTDVFCRQLLIPNSPEWIGLVSGVLLPLIYPSEWTEVEGIPSDDAAARWHEMLVQYWASTCGGDMTECCEPVLKQYRINSETGELEQSIDGGTTWQEVPNSVYSGAVEARPLSGDDGDIKRCEAANNIVDNLKDVQAGISEKLALTYTFYDFCIAILIEIVALILAGLTGGAVAGLVIPLIPKIIEMARALFGLTQEAYDAMFTESAWTITRCIMYCNIGADGKFTSGGWSQVKADLIDQLGGAYNQAGANIASMVDVWALKGLNNAARIGSGGEGNCDDCECDSPCNMLLWDVWLDTGVLVEKTIGHITVTAVSGGDGHYYANVSTGEADTCCCISIDTGMVTLEATGYIPCGTAVDAGNLNFAFSTASNANTFTAKAASAFTLTVTAVNCP